MSTPNRRCHADRRGTKPPPPRDVSKGAHRPGRRSTPKAWAHVAQRKARDNWPPRKIAKFLDVPLYEVRQVLAAQPRRTGAR